MKHVPEYKYIDASSYLKTQPNLWCNESRGYWKLVERMEIVAS